MIVDFRKYKELGIEVTDIAKRLMDYETSCTNCFFPSKTGTMMMGPTESESASSDRFIEAMKSIKNEINEIIDLKIRFRGQCIKKFTPYNVYGDKFKLEKIIQC